MVENKNLEELRKELEKAKRERLQAEHQLQRKKNQLSYRESYSRKERSDRLIVCGAIFEKYFPQFFSFRQYCLLQHLLVFASLFACLKHFENQTA